MIDLNLLIKNISGLDVKIDRFEIFEEEGVVIDRFNIESGFVVKKQSQLSINFGIGFEMVPFNLVGAYIVYNGIQDYFLLNNFLMKFVKYVEWSECVEDGQQLVGQTSVSVSSQSESQLSNMMKPMTQQGYLKCSLQLSSQTSICSEYSVESQQVKSMDFMILLKKEDEKHQISIYADSSIEVKECIADSLIKNIEFIL